MTRVLAVIHGALALAAFGIGNAVLGGDWSRPTVLHLIFGIVLLVSGLTLWKKGQGLRWAVTLNLGIGALVALALVLDRIAGPWIPSTGLTIAAIAFVALEVVTLRYAPPHPPQRENLP
jgi:hypothetical protein